MAKGLPYGWADQFYKRETLPECYITRPEDYWCSIRFYIHKYTVLNHDVQIPLNVQGRASMLRSMKETLDCITTTPFEVRVLDDDDLWLEFWFATLKDARDFIMDIMTCPTNQMQYLYSKGES